MTFTRDARFEATMTEAIDFVRLLREEKQKARLKRQQKQNTHLDEAEKERERTKQNDTFQPSAADDVILGLSTRPDVGPLSQYRVAQHNSSSKISSTVYYIPRFLLEGESALVDWLVRSLAWTTMRYSKRRVVALHATAAGGFPGPLQEVASALVDCGIFEPQQPPNHILINEYQPGHGILPHTDGPAYQPRTATLSIGGSSVLLNFTPRLSTDDIDPSKRHDSTAGDCLQVHLENQSLLVFTDHAYTNCCHGIDDQILTETSTVQCCNLPAGTTIERGYRISLTFRIKKGGVSLDQSAPST